MSQLITASNTVTMSSLEMAELTGKRHDSVKRTVSTLAESGVISYPQIVDGIKAANGVVPRHYLIGKRDSFVVVAQLCPEFTARLVDRWQELEAQVATPVLPSYAETLRLYADSIETNQRQAEQLAIAAPKVEALDRIATADGAICITSAAKHLQMRPKDLFAYLQRIGWIYRRTGSTGWLGYQSKTQQGLLEHKVTIISRSDGSEKVTEQVLVTGKGMAKLSMLLVWAAA